MKAMWRTDHVKRILNCALGILCKVSVEITKAQKIRKYLKKLRRTQK